MPTRFLRIVHSAERSRAWTWRSICAVSSSSITRVDRLNHSKPHRASAVRRRCAISLTYAVAIDVAVDIALQIRKGREPVCKLPSPAVAAVARVAK